MIVINLHLPSMVIGFFVGYIAVSAVWIWTTVHDDGNFKNGWDAGFEYGKSKSEPKKGEVEHDS